MAPPKEPKKRATPSSATPAGRGRPTLSVDTTPVFTPTLGNPSNPSPLSAVMRSPEHAEESPTAVTGMDPDEYPDLMLGDITQGPGWPSAADPGMYSAAEAIQAQRMNTMAQQISALTGLAMSQLGGSKPAAKVNKVGDYSSAEATIARDVTAQHQRLINEVMGKFTKQLKRKDSGPKGKPTTRAGENLKNQSQEFVKMLIATADDQVRDDLKEQLDQLSETAVGIFYKSLVQMLVPNSSGGVKAVSAADTNALEMLFTSFKGLIEDQFRSFVNDERPAPLKADTSKSAGGKQVKLFVKKVKTSFSAMDNDPEDEDHPVIAVLEGMTEDGLLALWVRLIKSGAAAPATDSPSTETAVGKTAADKTAAASKKKTSAAAASKAGTKRSLEVDDDDDVEDQPPTTKTKRSTRNRNRNDDEDV